MQSESLKKRAYLKIGSCSRTEININDYQHLAPIEMSNKPYLIKRVSTEELQQLRIKSYKYIL